MDKNRKCLSCGEPIADDSAADECPKCLHVRNSELRPNLVESSSADTSVPATAQRTFASEEPSPSAGPTITFSPSSPERPDRRIGRYKLLQQIGEGGCGVVFLAEQEVPVRRRVALKVIKPGMDTEEVLARFEAERQALALMDHPNIAKVLDAGATENGRPFFVMELVQGIKLTDYCDQNKLTTRQRLEIFIQVCKAVQHAHQKGIIHRDIKPSNILVSLQDGLAVPKIIDFGIAKAFAGQKLTDRTLFTAFEQFIGTPAYMSPEQAQLSGLDIDTRSDIYSLGVLLYELLTGRPPFDPKRLLEAGLEGIRRIIREEEPPRPSTKLSKLAVEEQTTTAKRQQTDAPRLIRLVRGDLDWIVMKCLEKDRGRRYETANGLAMDLQRHLDNEPVAARPPTAGYRLQKLVRGHRVAVGSIGAIAISLLVGSVVSTRFYLKEKTQQEKARQMQREAERQGKVARETMSFLTQMFSSIDPAVAKLREISAREVLDEAALTIGSAFPDEPLVELPMRRAFAEIYGKLGRSDLALPQAQAAVRLARAGYGQKDHPDVAESLNNLGSCLDAAGRSDEALTNREVSLAMLQRLYPGDHAAVANALNGLGFCLDKLGRSAEALKVHQSALSMRQRIYPGDHQDVAYSLNNVGLCLDHLGRSDEALSMFEAALKMRRNVFKGDHPSVALSLNNVGYCLGHLNRPAEANTNYEASLQMYQRIHKGDHPDVARELNNIAFYLDDVGQTTDALAKFKEALAMRQRIFRGDHPDVASSLNNVGYCLQHLRSFSEALTNYQAALEMYQRIYAEDHPAIATSLNNVARCLTALGRPAEALPMHEAALAMRQRIYHGDHPDIATDLSNLALCLDALGRTKEALPKFEEALAMSQRVHPGEHPSVAYGLANLGSCLDDLGRPEEAYQKYQEATKMLQDLLEKMPQSVAVKVQLAETQQKTGDVLREMGKETEALERYRTGLQIVESLLSAQVSSAQAIELRLSLRAKLHLEKAEVVVSQIMASGQAERLGLRKGDIIVRYNQRPIATSDELKRLTTRVKGSRIELEIRRGDQTLQPVASEGPLGLLCEDRSITNKM